MSVLAIAIAVALVGIVGCSGEPPPGIKTAEYDAKRAELMERLESRKKRTAKAAQTVATAEPAKKPAGFGAVDVEFSYDPTNRRDPFRSYEWERPDRQAALTERGPLEQFDLRQLELVAVVWATGNARALIQDPGGESYIVGTGAQIGKNSGRVVSIADDSLVVKETYVDFLGQETTKDIEMRIRGSEGGEFHVAK